MLNFWRLVWSMKLFNGARWSLIVNDNTLTLLESLSGTWSSCNKRIVTILSWRGESKDSLCTSMELTHCQLNCSLPNQQLTENSEQQRRQVHAHVIDTHLLLIHSCFLHVHSDPSQFHRTSKAGSSSQSRSPSKYMSWCFSFFSCLGYLLIFVRRSPSKRKGWGNASVELKTQSGQRVHVPAPGMIYTMTASCVHVQHY